MKLIFERSRPGRGNDLLPSLDVPAAPLPEKYRRKTVPRLPEPAHTVQGAQAVLARAEHLLCEITGMDAVTLQPAAGAHGEFLGLLLIKAYHHSQGDTGRTVILVPDSAHGTNPASAAMAGFTVKNIPSTPEGLVDLEALRAACGPDTAGLMLTNPNTVGLFEKDILELTALVHAAGGLVYYDGANLNAIMGVARPGDMGFDVCHLNLHKTFATPHGGGGPGSGPVGCKAFLAPFLPGSALCRNGGEHSIGQVRAFHANFLVVVKALAYLLRLGNTGVAEAAHTAVLNANYLKRKLEEAGYTAAFPGLCMHEFVLTLEELKKETGVSALDVAKSMLDAGIHPPTMYFPLIVHEALMFEPTETESPETLDEAAADFPRTRFVMCHFGNPFLEAAAAVLEKNPNVCADLSGLLEGRADLDRYFVERAGYVGLLRTWMDYLGCWDRFLYGTDWPIVNLAEYRDYVTRIVPEERRPAVFFDNANRVYGLGL